MSGQTPPPPNPHSLSRFYPPTNFQPLWPQWPGYGVVGGSEILEGLVRWDAPKGNDESAHIERSTPRTQPPELRTRSLHLSHPRNVHSPRCHRLTLGSHDMHFVFTKHMNYIFMLTEWCYGRKPPVLLPCCLPNLHQGVDITARKTSLKNVTVSQGDNLVRIYVGAHNADMLRRRFEDILGLDLQVKEFGPDWVSLEAHLMDPNGRNCARHHE